MAFGATLTVTINAVAIIMNRINQDSYGSEYFLHTALSDYRVKIRHTKEPVKGVVGVDRHNIEFTQTIFATLTVPQIVRQVYLVGRFQTNDDYTSDFQFMDGFFSYVRGGTVETDLINWMS